MDKKAWLPYLKVGQLCKVSSAPELQVGLASGGLFGNEIALELFPLPNPASLTSSQVLPLHTSPSKLPARSETISQGTPPKTVVEAGCKPRHSEVLTINADSENNWMGVPTGLNSPQAKRGLGNN